MAEDVKARHADELRNLGSGETWKNSLKDLLGLATGVSNCQYALDYLPLVRIVAKDPTRPFRAHNPKG